MTLRRGIRSAGLALVSAAIVVLLFTVSADHPLVRGLETASLDLRFRLRGLRPPGPEVRLILVDDRSLENLGRWPLSRALFARALEVLDHAGAKVVAFDLLFTEPDEPVPADLRRQARTAAAALDRRPQRPAPCGPAAARRQRSRQPLRRRHTRFRPCLATDRLFVYRPAGEAPSWISDSAYAQFDKSPLPPDFPLRPKSVVLPIEALARLPPGSATRASP